MANLGGWGGRRIMPRVLDWLQTVRVLLVRIGHYGHLDPFLLEMWMSLIKS